jgi:hypothetical protein
MKIFAILIILVLSGCSTGRSYHKRDSIWNLGYSDTQLSSNTWRVSYRGYGIAEDKAADFALFHAAKICLENDFSFFTIVEARETSTTQGAGYLSGGYGIAAAYQFPNASFTIRGHSEQPSDDSQAYESSFIYSSIKKKYKIRE